MLAVAAGLLAVVTRAGLLALWPGGAVGHSTGALGGPTLSATALASSLIARVPADLVPDAHHTHAH